MPSSASPRAAPSAAARESAARNRPNFTGYWRVVKVEGLDAFLKVKKEKVQKTAIDQIMMMGFLFSPSVLLRYALFSLPLSTLS